MIKGRRISILGDSISSYYGISNDATANATLIGNPAFYGRRFPLEKTYWMRLINAYDLTLCVNNSYSGGNLSGRDNPYSGVNRAAELSRDDGVTPEFIIVFMGLNDLGRGVDTAVFAADYETALKTVKDSYPDAAVCCVNLPDRDVRLKKRAEEFNEAILKAVLKMGDRFFVADLYESRLNGDFYYDNTLDGLHPDEDGMRIIADIIAEAIDCFSGK